MAVPTTNHLQFLQLARSAVRVPDSHPLLMPMLHVLAARAADSADRGLKPMAYAEDAVNVERSLMLDAQGVLSRHFRTVLLGGEHSGGDTSLMVFEPQKDCIPMRLVVPSVDAALIFFSLEAGLAQYFASNDGIVGGMFGASAQAAFIRPIYTKVGQDITMRSSAASTAGAGYVMQAADMSAEGRLNPTGQLRPMGFKTTVLASGGSVVTLDPQVNFQVRKLSLRPVGSDSLAPVTLLDFKVGVDPQFLSANAVSAEVFDATVPWQLWLDADQAVIGQKLTFRFASRSGDQVLAGVVEGDVSAS